MQVFISWSGPRSRAIADALRNWLPKVIQSVKPWMSDEDINAGARWLTEISTSLNSTSVGIVCVTPENQNNPWLLFEVGALSKTLEQTCVCPLVFEMTPGQLSGPLTQFQANELTRDGVAKILSTINKLLGEKQIATTELDEIVDVWWPKLLEKIDGLPPAPTPLAARSTNDQMEELLSLAREQLRRENLRLEASQERDEKFSEMLSFMQHYRSALGSMLSNAGSASTAMQAVMQKFLAAAPNVEETKGTEIVEMGEAAKLMLSTLNPTQSFDLSKMDAMTTIMQEMQAKDKARTESMLSFAQKNASTDSN